tara:strand:+ start:797 stop:1027 length:231 start_codon:yes stop_codon:yes gene_type:complete
MTNNIANKYSTIFLTLVFRIIDFIDDPKMAHKQMDGKQINGAVMTTNAVAYKKGSSLGKKAVAAVKATTHALGFIN